MINIGCQCDFLSNIKQKTQKFGKESYKTSVQSTLYITDLSEYPGDLLDELTRKQNNIAVESVLQENQNLNKEPYQEGEQEQYLEVVEPRM